MKKSSSIFGLIFIFIGGFLLYAYFTDVNIFSMSTMWPMFVLGLGLIFEMSFFMNKKAPGLLVPGGILTTLGLLFFFESFTSWRFSQYTWPIYIFSVAIGLLQMYLFSVRSKGLFIAISILFLIGGTSLTLTVLSGITSFINLGLILPIALIAVGIYFLFLRDTQQTE
ncbi:UNVERIFIED_CONTAM: hypothetical protein Cloal_3574 [Acetivibrio alkalicellulosi]